MFILLMQIVYVRKEVHNRLLQNQNTGTPKVLHNTKKVSFISTFSIQCTLDFLSKW